MLPVPTAPKNNYSAAQCSRPQDCDRVNRLCRFRGLLILLAKSIPYTEERPSGLLCSPGSDGVQIQKSGRSHFFNTQNGPRVDHAKSVLFIRSMSCQMPSVLFQVMRIHFVPFQRRCITEPLFTITPPWLVSDPVTQSSMHWIVP